MTKTIKNVRRFVGLVPLCLGAAACTDAYEGMFLDPDRSTDARIEFLFTRALTQTEFQFGYWEGYYRFYRNIARWSQVSGTVNGEHMMDENPARWEDYWREYYTEKSMYLRETWARYDALPDAQKPDYEVYFQLGKILNAYNTAEMTDLWGDMPYSDAFTARHESGQNLFPTFDAQESIYDSVLKDLKDASDAIARPNVVIPASLGAQDVFLRGNLTAWRRFANSLRLRLAMRLSEVAPDKARAVVQEVLTGGYPLVESNADNIVWQTTPDYGGDDRGRATRESPNETFAPKLMTDIMVASNDPRLPVIFEPNTSGAFVGLPSSPDQQPLAPDSTQFARLNSITFDRDNNVAYNYPGHVITASEVWFLKAEAYQRGWASGDARAAYEQAMRLSVEFYYALRNANPAGPPVAPPSPALVDAFIGGPTVAYDGTLARIATQKWIHLGINQPYESWAEQRRLDLPNLGVDTFGGRPLPRTVRILYPSTEITNNRQNYEAVRAKDTPVTRVWWDLR